MKVLLFGATGMIGQGTLQVCLDDPGVTQVVAIVRSATGTSHPKLREVVHQDFFDYGAIEGELRGHDACLFCLGISSVGMDEAAYTRTTHDLTLAAAEALLKQSPQAVFEYVSGASTDGSEKGRVMWARVKGKTENDLLKMPFRGVYMLRPGYIQPVGGVRSKTALYQAIYSVVGFAYPLTRALFPRHVMTTHELGRAMLKIAREGAPERVLEAPAIIALGRTS